MKDLNTIKNINDKAVEEYNNKVEQIADALADRFNSLPRRTYVKIVKAVLSLDENLSG